MQLAPTARDELSRDGTARLYRFRAQSGAPAGGAGPPLLLVPSLINRWYVLDLRPGASLAAAFTAAGVDTYCLDWGAPEDEDRFLTWDEVLGRLDRAARFVSRATGAKRVSLLGYCMGGTLAAIDAALHPDRVASLVNLAGPIDFAAAGLLGLMTDRRWFDADAVAAAGNVHPLQMQSGFVMMRPTAQLAKWVNAAARAGEPAARETFLALEAWAGDNVPFPAAAYATYVRELYQDNQLVRGEHRVSGRRVDLAAIDCPVLAVVAEKDTICPPAAARALIDRCGAEVREVLTTPGGHVGAVVGGSAPTVLYPAITAWLKEKACASTTSRSSSPAPAPAWALTSRGA